MGLQDLTDVNADAHAKVAAEVLKALKNVADAPPAPAITHAILALTYTVDAWGREIVDRLAEIRDGAS